MLTLNQIEPVFEIDFGSGFVLVSPPMNWKAIKLEAIFTSEHPSASLQSINFEWVDKTAKDILSYWAIGSNFVKGLALRITIGTYVLPICVLDAPNASTEVSCDIVRTPIKRIQSIDWFIDQAKSFNFAYLDSLGLLPNVKNIPYCISYIPDAAYLIMIGMQEVAMIIEITKAISDVTAMASEEPVAVAGSATVGFAGAAVLVIKIIDIVAECAYIVFLAISVVSIAQKITDQIWQSKKYKLGMRVEDLILSGLTHIDPSMSFSSTILRSGNYKDVTLLPKKIIIPTASAGKVLGDISFKRSANEINNPNAHGYPDYASFAQFLDDIKIMFNAEDKVYTGKYELEEKHFWNNSAAFQLPNEGEVGYTYLFPDPHSFNMHELASSYLLQYPLDDNELNTIHRYDGTTCCVQMHPQTPGDQRRLLLPGFTDITFPFAQAKRKEYLNDAEQLVQHLMNAVASVFNTIISVVNGIISAINGVLHLINKALNLLGISSNLNINPIQMMQFSTLNYRIGWLELTNNTFNIPKLFIGENIGGDWHVSPNNQTYMSASALMANFHGKNLMTRGNQWIIYRNKKMKMCLGDYLKILNNNIFTTADNRIGKFEKIVWNVYNNEAESMDYRIKQDYCFNMIETITVDGN